MAANGDTAHSASRRVTVSLELWRADGRIYGRQIAGGRGGTLQAAQETIDALAELTQGERLPMLLGSPYQMDETQRFRQLPVAAVGFANALSDLCVAGSRPSSHGAGP